MNRRRFNSRERVSLFLRADGKCAECGDELPPGWHADHVEPYSRGGVTAAWNGQALCRVCNLKKGSQMPVLHTTNDRPWQSVALNDIRVAEVSAKPSFMLEATPGAGKTRLAIQVMKRGLDEGRYSFVVVVVPTRTLKRQWANAAGAFGVMLDPKFLNRNGDVAIDFAGVVVTYGQVASEPDVFRRICDGRDVLVVFDEIHHAGDNRSWGASIQAAFHPATFKLLLTGTPFRDKGFIPFVQYVPSDKPGILKSVADHRYGYQQALNGGVCRPVMFASFDGTMTWIQAEGTVSADFKDELPEAEAKRRLRAALDVRGNWLPGLIREADQELTQIRLHGHPDAAGLIVVFEQEDARRIAPLVESITGESPIVAVSDDDDAEARIERFKAGSQRWMIAVKMVSEGVDIPRLRVGVYATRIIAQLFFRQFVGRFVRSIEGIEDQTAYVYIPADPELIEYARQIAEEIDHEVKESYEQLESDLRDLIDRYEQESERRDLFGVIDTTDPAFDSLIHGGESFTDAELKAAESVKLAGGIPSWVPAAYIAAALRVAGQSIPTASPQPQPATDEPLDVVKDRVRRSCNFLVNKLHKQTGMTPKEINGWLAVEVGGYIHENTLEQLRERERLLLKHVNGVLDVSQRPRS